MNSKNNNEREIGRLGGAWYGGVFDDDEDIIDIRPRRQRKSVTGSGSARSSASAQTRPATSAQTRPAASAQTRSAASAQTRPAASAQTRPAASAQTRPAASAQTRSAASAQTRSAANAQTRSAASAQSRDRDAARILAAQNAQKRVQTITAGAEYPRRQNVPGGDTSRRMTSLSPEQVRIARDVEERRSEAAASRRPIVGKTKRRKKQGITVGCVIRRTLLVILTVILFAAGSILAVANTLANGPSETARNKAVMSAMQASATKWAPGLFLSDEVVEQIIADSKVVITDVRPINEASGDDTESPGVISEDRWEKAIDGMIYETVNGKTFKGYVLLIKDPSRVSVAISDKSFKSAQRIFEIADQYGAIAAINGGEFPDNGVQTGANPIGLTYAQGECVWDDGFRRTFIGFTKDNKLYVEEGTTRAQADEAGIRDAVAFQNGNTLITNDGENVTYYYADSNTGVAQRTGIGQLADGTVMFLVTDGRTASSMGATKNDIIDTFAKYGAITAGLLDGGSSAMLYYRNWYDKYNVDKSQLDEWQIMGLVNRYKAFTNPRQIPTFFIVK